MSNSNSHQPRLVEALGYDKEKAEIAEMLGVDVSEVHALDIVNESSPSVLNVTGKAEKLTPTFEGVLLEVRDEEDNGKLVTLFVSKQLADSLEDEKLEITIKRA
jgi:hypothetical protein